MSSVPGFPTALAIQPDGKIVVIGNVWNGHWDIVIARYNTDGSLDDGSNNDRSPSDTFGNAGTVVRSFGSMHDQAYGVAIQADGKILVAGTTSSAADAYNFLVARFNPNGSLDDGSTSDATPGDSFGTSGRTITSVVNQSDIAYSLAIQPDGRVILSGHADIDSTASANQDFALVRYNANGSLDTTFGSSGIVLTGFGSLDDQSRSLLIQPDGRIVAAGYARSGPGSRYEVALTRYNTDGSLDTSFGNGGRRTATFHSGDSLAFDVAMQSDGKLLVAGSASSGTDSDFLVARFTTTGNVDTSFGNQGQMVTSFGLGADVANGIAIQNNDKIVLVGRATNASSSDSDFALVRYNIDGSLDYAPSAEAVPTTSVTTQTPGIFEFDLSGLQSLLAENPSTTVSDTLIEDALTQVQLQLSYRSVNLNFPTSISLVPTQRAVVGACCTSSAVAEMG